MLKVSHLSKLGGYILKIAEPVPKTILTFDLAGEISVEQGSSYDFLDYRRESCKLLGLPDAVVCIL